MNPDVLADYLFTDETGEGSFLWDRSRIYYRDEVDSTNEWAKLEGGRGIPGGSVYLADFQSAGKGRRGRVWETPPGTAVAMSVLLRPEELPAERISMLTLVMGMAAAAGIRKATGIATMIKWPNDVVCGGRKMSGILTELSPHMDYVVIGIGLNINMTEFPKELENIATSAAIECGKTVSREQVTAEVLRAFAAYYEIFMQEMSMRNLREEYEGMLANAGTAVRVLDSREPYSGTALGINDFGELLVRRGDGKIAEVCSGEVSVRGIYGYV